MRLGLGDFRLTDNVHALSLTSHLPLSSLARCSALFPHPAAPGSLSRAAYPGPACMLFRAAYHTARACYFRFQDIRNLTLLEARTTGPTTYSMPDALLVGSLRVRACAPMLWV